MAEENESEGKKSSKGRLKMILIVTMALLLVAGVSIGATWFFFRSYLHIQQTKAATSAKVVTKKYPKAHYLSLKPPLVVNFEGQNELHYLQVGIDVMSYDPKVLDEIKTDMPPLRNDLIMLFTGQTTETLISRKGRIKLRSDVLDTVRKVVAKNHPKDAKKIKAIYFTSFVMQ